MSPGEGTALYTAVGPHFFKCEFCPTGCSRWNVPMPGLWEKRISLATYVHLDSFSVLRQNRLRVDRGWGGGLQSGGLALIKKNTLFGVLNQAEKTKFSL